jgi:Ca-activated chloride channel family protein
LQPGENHVETYSLTLRKAGLLRAELEVQDDLAADNVAYAFAEPPSALSVLVVGPGNLFLEQALLVLPEVNVFKAASLSAEEATAAYAKYDVVIFDRVALPARPQSGGVMLIAAGGWDELAGAGQELSSPAITQWQRDHPVLRNVNLAATRIARGRALQPGARAAVLARAGDSCLIAAEQQPELRALAFGWNFLDSDLPLRIGFPVLLGNCVRWLAEARAGTRPMTVRPGELLRFTAPPEATEAQATLADGTRRRVSVAEGQVAFTETERVGVYHLKAGNKQWQWAADLRSPEESDLTPGPELKLGQRQVKAGTGPPKTEEHLWPYLALFGLAVLLGEWHLYHRRY